MKIHQIIILFDNYFEFDKEKAYEDVCNIQEITYLSLFNPTGIRRLLFPSSCSLTQILWGDY